MLNRLFHGSWGFMWGVRFSAFLTLALLVIANLCMRPLAHMLPSQSHNAPRMSSVMLTAILDMPYILTISGSTLVLWGLFFPYFYLQLYAGFNDVSPTLAFYLLSILNASSIFGRTLPNFLADRLGQFNLVCPVAVLSAGLTFVLLGATSAGGMIAFAIFYGFVSGAFSALLPPTIVSLTSNMDELSVRMGLGFCLNSLGLLTGTPITGALLIKLEWWKPTVFSGAVISAGTINMVIARYLMTKRKGTQLV